MVDLPVTPFSHLLGLNNRGQEVGYFQDAAQQNHAYIRDAHGNCLVPQSPAVRPPASTTRAWWSASPNP